MSEEAANESPENSDSPIDIKGELIEGIVMDANPVLAQPISSSSTVAFFPAVFESKRPAPGGGRGRNLIMAEEIPEFQMEEGHLAGLQNNNRPNYKLRAFCSIFGMCVGLFLMTKSDSGNFETFQSGLALFFTCCTLTLYNTLCLNAETEIEFQALPQSDLPHLALD